VAGKGGDKRPIIIVKKKAHGHAGHHGGAWKVAYADFVTAMMAFFMVMWIIGMDQNVRNSIEGYFSNPIGYKKGYNAGRSPLSSGASPAVVQTTPVSLLSRQAEEDTLEKKGGEIKEKLKEAGLNAIGDRIEIIKTNDGLRIELAEGLNGQEFFALASASMTETMKKTLEIIAGELSPLRNPIIVEGHTDAAQYAGLYSNWELSADRANAARRTMEAAGLNGARVVEVRGMADRQLRNPGNPLDPRNRRITILLPFVTPPPGEADPAAAPTSAPTTAKPGTSGTSGA
jgi:chemotaxis protein MotB